MASFEEILSQLQRINTPKDILKKRSIKELPKIIWNDEQIRKIIQVTYANSVGILIATDKRLIFIDKGVMWGLKVENFPYSQISSLQHELGMVLADIIISTTGKTIKFKNIEKKQCRDFCNYVTSLIAQKSENASQPSQISHKRPEINFSDLDFNFEKPSKSIELNMIPFYKKTWFIWLMLFFVYPVGLALMWKFSLYGKRTKITISCVLSIFFIFALANPQKDTPQSVTAQNITSSQNDTTVNNAENNKKLILSWYTSLLADISMDDRATAIFIDTINDIGNGSVNEVGAYETFNKLDNIFASIHGKLIANHDAPSELKWDERNELDDAVENLADSVSSKGYACSELVDAIDERNLKPSVISNIKNSLDNSTKNKQQAIIKLAAILTKYDIKKEDIDAFKATNNNSSKSDKKESQLHKLLN